MLKKEAQYLKSQTKVLNVITICTRTCPGLRNCYFSAVWHVNDAVIAHKGGMFIWKLDILSRSDTNSAECGFHKY